MTTPPPRQVRTRPVRYHHDVGLLLDHLAELDLLPTAPEAPGGRRPVDTVLLESVDITTKASRTTVALLQCAARLTCQGHTVRVESLPGARADGREAIARLRRALGRYEVPRAGSPAGPAGPQGADGHRADGREGPEDLMTLSIPSRLEDAMEERERLRAPSTVEPLRVLAAGEVDHPHLPLEAGVVAFDYLATIESLPPVGPGANTCPDYLFYDARIILVIDHPTRRATLVGASVDAADLQERIEALGAAIDRAGTLRPAASQAAPAADQKVVHACPTQSDRDFAATVEGLKEAIDAGDVYQVVPSRGFTMDCPHALGAYHELRESNPSPYMFYLGAPEFELLGASPESALEHSAATGRVSIRPIAGTRPRGLSADGGVDHERDTRLELELRTDAKEVAEHVMLVDLARNDVARVSVPGTREVSALLRVDRYSRVMHLVSEVTGQLAPDLDALDALRASLTMGTLTGAPKLRAAELIRQVEGVRRGSYGGTVGYLRGDGELDTCIVIRSAFVRDGRALVQAGAGVVSGSSPAAEAAETVHKAAAVLQAVAASQGARLAIATEPAQEV